MQFFLSKQFEKDFAKLPKGVKQKTIAVLQKFAHDPKDASMRNHRLSGKWKNYFSINITGDTRAIYVFVESDTVRFVAVGSHSELYGK